MGARSSADFFWVAHQPALDFVNTLAAGPAGPLELLPSDAELWRWARTAGLARSAPAAPRAGLDPAIARLRAALRELFEAVCAGKPAPRKALEQLNEALALPGARLRLAQRAGRFERVRASPATNAELQRALADSAAELLASAAAQRVRRCAGVGCVLLFLDVSKSGQRRWCSMSGCGNRAKVRAHYRRARGRA